MAVTIQKIAELSGVSRGTVDRVLHGRPNVNPMIREKVVRAAEKLGYQPPVPPKSADCRQAAILIPQWTDGYFNRQIVSGIRKALRYIADPAFILTEQPLRTCTCRSCSARWTSRFVPAWMDSSSVPKIRRRSAPPSSRQCSKA